MSNIAAYENMIEGKWSNDGLMFDFKPITNFLNDSVRIEVIVTDNLTKTTSLWNCYIKGESGRMYIYYSNDQLTNQKAEITLLNAHKMLWEIITEDHSGHKVTFNRL